jgi:tetratricopeptide (TPR) repeat protein
VLDDAERHRRAGEIELADARLDEAIEVAHQLLAQHDIASGHFLLGRLLLSRERLAEARQRFERALELRPDLAEARIARGLLTARELATLASRAGHPLGAGADSLPSELERLRRSALADLHTRVVVEDSLSMIDRLKVRAEVAQLEGDLQSADELWREVLRFDPVNTDAKVARSQIANELGDGDAAWALAMSAIDLYRGFGPAYVALGDADVVQRAVRQHEMAAAEASVGGGLTDFSALLAANPSDALAQGMRGQIHARRAAGLAAAGRREEALAAWAEAVEDYSAALLLEPSLKAALHHRGVARWERERLLYQLGRFEEGRIESARAAEDFAAARR